MKKCSTALASLTFVLLTSATAGAEWYIGGYGGLNMPGKLTNVQGTGTVEGSGILTGTSGSTVITTSDLELENSVTYGAKVGYWLPRWKMLGLELEASTATPNFKQQGYTRTETVTLGGSTVTATSQAQLPSAKMRVSTVALNLLFRYEGRFEPYVGAGVGFYRADFESNDPNVGKSSDTAFGMSFLAGARYYLTKKLAAFGEYKYNAANFDFGDRVLFKGDYNAHIFVGGLSFHLK
jgi:opacity protein-like surface antigen